MEDPSNKINEKMAEVLKESGLVKEYFDPVKEKSSVSTLPTKEPAPLPPIGNGDARKPSSPVRGN
jgi:hypothetical protein